MNNLQKAKRAINGVKEYQVLLTERSCFSITLEATSSEEANKKAREMLNDGELSENGNGGVDTDSITLMN